MKDPKQQEKREVLFDKRKYYILIAGILVTALGFILMIGGGTDDPNEFSYDLFSHRRITLAPILVLAGYGVMIYSILTKKAPKKESDKK